jgi:hypothetical protein
MSRARALALIVGLLLHALALWLMSGDALLAWVLLAHVAGSLAWGYGAAILLPLGQHQHWWFMAAPALLFPVLGPLTSLALARTLRRPPVDRSARRYVIWSEEPQTAFTTALPSSAAGQSIVEILQSPRIQLRRNAVLALRDLDPQLAIPLLRKGLQDSDEQVRIYAQNILSSMLERYESGIKELTQRVSAEPLAALNAVRLAEQYHELVYLDVAGDDETAAHYLAQAQSLLLRAADLAPEDREIAFLGLKCAIRARDSVAAEQWAGRLDRDGYDVRQTLPWLMELFFMQGNWTRLREMFAVFERSQMVNPRIEELVRFWTRATPPAA